MATKDTVFLAKKANVNLRTTISDNRLLGLIRLMHGYHLRYIGALVAVALGAFVRTRYYTMLQSMVDDVNQGTMEQKRLITLALSFVGLAVLEGAFALIRGAWSARTAEGIIARLRTFLYDQIQRLPFSFHDYAKTGELIQRSTSDVDALRRFYADQMLGIGRIMALFLVNFFTLLRMNVRLGLTAVALIPVIVAMSYFFFGGVSKAYKKYQEQDARLSTILQENLSGVRVVRAFAQQAYESEKFNDANWEKYRRGKHLLLMHSAYWPLSDTICAGQTILAMAVGAVMAIRGDITVGTYMAAMGMVVWIIWPVRNLGRLIVNVSTGLVSYARVGEVIAEEREDVDSGLSPDQPVKGAIEFRNVTFSYVPRDVLVVSDEPKKKPEKSVSQASVGVEDAKEKEASAPLHPVLKDVSFRCEPGQVVAFLGSTGSGKTSILNLLMRYFDCQEGEILLDGLPIEDYSRHYVRKQIGIVEQEPFLFARSIRENIAMSHPGLVDDAAIIGAAKAAAIHDIIESFPAGYNTLVGEKGVTLSGGQRQRVAIARALLKDPRILVLDDATSSVDTETEEHIQKALDILIPGRTTFIIAHRIQSVMKADLIVVLDKGRVVQQGTHKDLIHEDGLYRRIYELQSRIETELASDIALRESVKNAVSDGVS